MNTLTEVEKAYLAGFLDGEGCIHIANCRIQKRGISLTHRLLIQITQSNPDVLSYWKEKTGLGFVAVRRHEILEKSLPEKYRRNCSDSYTWHITDREAEELLIQIGDYLMVKREQARLAMEYRHTIRKHSAGRVAIAPEVIELREHIRQQIMECNQKVHRSSINK